MKIKKFYRLNVVIPFVTMGDIAFLLLIFLIVTSSIQKLPEISFQLPEAKEFDKIHQNGHVELLVNENNIFFNGQAYTLPALEKVLYNGQHCILSADKNSSFQLVHSLITLLKERGYEKISFTVKRKAQISQAE